MALLGIVFTLPFLPVAWVVGMALVSVAGEESYLLGAALSVLLQVLLLLALWSLVTRRRKARV